MNLRIEAGIMECECLPCETRNRNAAKILHIGLESPLIPAEIIVNCCSDKNYRKILAKLASYSEPLLVRGNRDGTPAIRGSWPGQWGFCADAPP